MGLKKELIMRNTLTDLNNYLFETLERLMDDDMTEQTRKLTEKERQKELRKWGIEDVSP